MHPNKNMPSGTRKMLNRNKNPNMLQQKEIKGSSNIFIMFFWCSNNLKLNPARLKAANTGQNNAKKKIAGIKTIGVKRIILDLNKALRILLLPSPPN